MLEYPNNRAFAALVLEVISPGCGLTKIARKVVLVGSGYSAEEVLVWT